MIFNPSFKKLRELVNFLCKLNSSAITFISLSPFAIDLYSYEEDKGLKNPIYAS